VNAYLSKHGVGGNPRWALDGKQLSADFNFGQMLAEPSSSIESYLRLHRTDEVASQDLVAPLEPSHEVWACGVTYLRSRSAREAESTVRDVYSRVYEAERPETFFKAVGWRVVGHGAPIRVRRDSGWTVPEPELTLVVNGHGEIVGYTAGNDVSARDIEGENPLYLPQAKVYDGSCAIGPGIMLCSAAEIAQLRIEMQIERAGSVVFEGDTSVAQMKRTPAELVSWLIREITFPTGAFVLTGAGIVPPDAFSLKSGDRVRIKVGELVLENPVA